MPTFDGVVVCVMFDMKTNTETKYSEEFGGAPGFIALGTILLNLLYSKSRYQRAAELNMALQIWRQRASSTRSSFILTATIQI
jgi:hypothetical protein